MSITKYAMADLFAGGGGFHLAANKVGGIEVTYACEYKKNIAKVYEDNFGIDSFCDMYTLKDEVIKRLGIFDIVTAGFPCQPFSSTGAQRGFDDATSGGAFKALLNFIRVSSPKAVILENVAGLTSLKKFKETFAFIIESLEGLGYSVKWKVLRSCDFGNVQIRKRVYIVCLRDADNFVFPVGNSKAKTVGDVLCPVSELVMDDFYTQEYFDVRSRIIVEKILCGERVGDFTWRFKGLSDSLPLLDTKISDTTKGIVFRDTRILDSWDMGEYKDRGYNKGLYRRLTLQECSKIQGYPYAYNWSSASKTLKGYIIGNSITVAVGEAVIREVVKFL